MNPHNIFSPVNILMKEIMLNIFVLHVIIISLFGLTIFRLLKIIHRLQAQNEKIWGIYEKQYTLNHPNGDSNNDCVSNRN